MTEEATARRIVKWETGTWWAYREIRLKRGLPADFQRLKHDPETGITTGWEPAHRVAWWQDLRQAMEGTMPYQPGIYELTEADGVHYLQPASLGQPEPARTGGR